VNWFDVLLVSAVAVSVVSGFAKGFGRTAVSFLSFVIALGCAFWFYAPLSFWLRSYISSRPAANATAFLSVFIGISILGCIAERQIVNLIRKAQLTWPDRFLGAGFGLLQGALSATIIALVMLAFMPRPLPRAMVESRWLPYASEAVDLAVAVAPPELKLGVELARRDLDKVAPAPVRKGIENLANTGVI
jgi:membrane protein required for colicin V production